MAYACLILKSVLQSWGGIVSERPNRDAPRMTELEPTRSGIVGLIRSAYGYSRDSYEGEWLKNSKIIVRVDSPGKLHRDYQIASLVHHSYDRRQDTKILNREIPKFYLEEATFTVLLAVPPAEQESFIKAMTEPKWSPFLGRKNCPPILPPFLGMVDTVEPHEYLKTALPVFWGISEKNLEQKVVQIYEPEYRIEPVDFLPRNQTYTTSNSDFFVSKRAKIEDGEDLSSIKQYYNMIATITETRN